MSNGHLLEDVHLGRLSGRLPENDIHFGQRHIFKSLSQFGLPQAIGDDDDLEVPKCLFYRKLRELVDGILIWKPDAVQSAVTDSL